MNFSAVQGWVGRRWRGCERGTSALKEMWMQSGGGWGGGGGRGGTGSMSVRKRSGERRRMVMVMQLR